MCVMRSYESMVLSATASQNKIKRNRIMTFPCSCGGIELYSPFRGKKCKLYNIYNYKRR